jgi:hypothetical protein
VLEPNEKSVLVDLFDRSSRHLRKLREGFLRKLRERTFEWRVVRKLRIEGGVSKRDKVLNGRWAEVSNVKSEGGDVASGAPLRSVLNHWSHDLIVVPPW